MYNDNKLSVCLFAITIIIHNNLVNCAFLDLTDIDDPLALLWNTKDGIPAYKNQKCTVQVDGAIMTGDCKHYSHCILTGGRPSGLCGILSTCCIYDATSCAKTTKAKISYFENGLNPLVHSDCTYTINKFSNNVCQARLDFDMFELSEATEATGINADSGSTYYYHECNTDYLSVAPNPFNQSIPKLCGHNTKQHIYIHWDQAIKQLQLSIHLGSRFVYDTAIQNPLWRIRVTQLECPRNWNLVKISNNLVQDHSVLAPTGIIQYFTDRTGRIRSFNLDPTRALNQRHSSTAWTNYGIAIKRSITDCQIKFTNSYLRLPGNDDGMCNSYLFIPGLTTDEDATNALISNKYELCTSNVATDAITTPFTFSMKANGPFYLGYVTNVQADSAAADLGFDITYEILSC